MEAEARSLIGEIRLKNLRLIYESPSEYVVVQIDRHGNRHEQDIPKVVAETVANILEGEQISVDEATGILEPMIDDGIFQTPFTYGHKLHYYVQDDLLVLVAIGRAERRKGGRAFVYRIL